MEIVKSSQADAPPPQNTVTYSFGGATHHLHVFDKISPDVVLAHQSKVVGFFLKTGTILPKISLDPVPRVIKDQLRG
jgi:hypothetical protein